MKRLITATVEFAACIVYANVLILVGGLSVWAALQILRAVADMFFTVTDVILTSVTLDRVFFLCAFVIGTIFGTYIYCKAE